MRRGFVKLHTCLPLSVDGGKGHESPAECEQVRKGKGEALPVNVKHCGCVCSILRLWSKASKA